MPFGAGAISIGSPIPGGVANRVLFFDTAANLATDAKLQFNNATGALTIGSVAGDSITINAGAINYGNNIIITRSAGTIAAGIVDPISQTINATGDPGGTTNLRGNVYNVNAQGANAFSAATCFRGSLGHTGTNTITVAIGFNQGVDILSSGNITNATGVQGGVNILSTGSVTGSANCFAAGSPVVSGAGTIGTINGLTVANLGNAVVTTANGITIADQSGAANHRGITCVMTSGANKLGLNFSGSVANVVAGNIRFGSTTAATQAVSVTGKLDTSDKIFPGTDAAAAQTVCGIFAGSGVPNNANGNNGDFYFRSDGTVAGNTVQYHKEAGAWVAFT